MTAFLLLLVFLFGLSVIAAIWLITVNFLLGIAVIVLAVLSLIKLPMPTLLEKQIDYLLVDNDRRLVGFWVTTIFWLLFNLFAFGLTPAEIVQNKYQPSLFEQEYQRLTGKKSIYWEEAENMFLPEKDRESWQLKKLRQISWWGWIASLLTAVIYLPVSQIDELKEAYQRVVTREKTRAQTDLPNLSNVKNVKSDTKSGPSPQAGAPKGEALTKSDYFRLEILLGVMTELLELFLSKFKRS